MGAEPAPYHLVNVLWHAAGALALWRVLRSLRVPGAWLGAALWALHPVAVESVAWVSEMKNTESAPFFLLSILFFVKWRRARETGGGRNYALSLLFAAMAMASKSSTVILPLVLCLSAWWVEGRWQWRNLARVAPFFLMSVIASALAVWTQKMPMVTEGHSQWVRTWPERLVTAGEVVWFYLGKLLWPHPLVAIYPGWQFATGQIGAGRLSAYLPLLAVGIVLLVLWFNRASWARPWFFIFAYFLAALLPVLGFLDNHIFLYSLVFDHFQYLAAMGPLALAGAGLSRWADFAPPSRVGWRVAGCAGLLLTLGLLSRHRTWAYESDEKLWADALAKNPNAWLVHHNYGNALLQKERWDEAIAQYQKVVEMEPEFPLAHINLGIALAQKGRLDEAMAEYQKALKINPNFGDAHNNIGSILLQKGRLDEAMTQFQKALEIDPTDAKARYNLGNMLSQKGQTDEAIAQYQKAVDIDPNSVEARNNLGNAFLQKGEVDEATAQCERAVQIDPNSVEAHNNLGTAFLRKGQVDAAIGECQVVLAIDPNSVAALNNLGYALLQKGRADEAIAQVQQVLKIDPTNAEARYNFGNALLQKGQLDGAIEQYKKALALDPKRTQVHLNLGNALLQKGRTDEAIAQYQQALALDPNSAGAHGNLGFALFKKGELDEAIVQDEKALALNPNIVQIHDNLGVALAQKGRLAEATAQFQEALQLNPADAVAQSHLAKMPAAPRR